MTKTSGRQSARAPWRAALTVVLVAAPLSALPLTASPAVAATATPKAVVTPFTTAATPSVGMNLTGVSDWTTAYPFVDVFRTARPWISQKAGAQWGQGPAVVTDNQGWVRSLAANQWVDTPLFTDQNGHAPKGRYTVTWDGDGDLSLWGADTLKIYNRTTNRFEFDLGSNGIFLKISRVNPFNYPRNIHVWMPTYERTGATQVFNPAFLDKLKGVSTLRFMDWMGTNDPRYDVSSFASYPRANYYTQTVAVAPELMTDLANRVGADAWFNVPYAASDDFVRGFAQAVKAGLAADRKVYLEYSNENWNSSFAAATYVQDQGVKLGLSTDRFQAGLRYQAQRSTEIFQIWRDVFGTQAGSRLVRVLAAQSANSWTGDQVLSWKDSYQQADAIAIAPYFHCAGPYLAGDTKLYDPGDPKVTKQVKAAGATRVLDNCQKEIDTAIRDQISAYRLLAEQYGVALVGYEGGQHLVGFGGAENDNDLTALFLAANRNARMGTLYTNYLNTWQAYGGGMMAAFSHITAPGKWGSWGLLEYLDQPPTAAPKFTAVQAFAKALQTGPARDVVPIITGLAAHSGPRAGGTEVAIDGSRLANVTTVKFDTTVATFRKLITNGQVTRLVAVAPAHLPGTVNVTITNSAGTSATGSRTTFTYTPSPPTITKLSTSTVAVNGGTVVTVTGTNLTGANAVITAGIAYNMSVKVVSDTQLQFTVVPWRPGTFDLVVKTPYGTSQAVKLNYTYR